MNHMTDCVSSADISIFLPKISKFCYIKKYRYRFHLDTYFLTLLIFLASLKIVLINMVSILMITAKIATPGFLKIKIFFKKAYGVIVFSMTSPTEFYHVIQIIMYMWFCDPILVTLAFLREKLSYTQFYNDLTKKTAFFEGWSWFKLNN